MRYRIKDYVALYDTNTQKLGLYFNVPVTLTFNGGVADTASTRLVRESIRLVVDETIGGSILCSTGEKDNLFQVLSGSTQGYDACLIFSISNLINAAQADGDEDEVAALQSLAATDEFTIEMDFGESLAEESDTIQGKIDDAAIAIEAKIDAIPEVDLSTVATQTTLVSGIETLTTKVDNIDFTPVEDKVDNVSNLVSTESQVIQEKIDNIDLSPIETKVDEGVSTLSTKIDNIDLSAVAQQGENAEATNSAIYEAVKHLPNLSLLYAARAEQNDDGENTYSIILPVSAKVVQEVNGVATIQL